jgi:8-oxo-dGTP diphosphatase
MDLKEKRPKVGVAVIIIKDGKVLLGKRIGSHGDGTWNFPGGHLEYGENWEDCAMREIGEETGLKIVNVKFGFLTNDVFEKEEKHYITIFMLADCDSGEPEIKEPEKCAGWDWFDWDEMPEPLFLPIVNLKKQNYNPFRN